MFIFVSCFGSLVVDGARKDLEYDHGAGCRLLSREPIGRQAGILQCIFLERKQFISYLRRCDLRPTQR